MKESHLGDPVDQSVAVVVPLHNGAAFIADTLTSIQNQTFPPREVIVVDDGSSDRGREIVREHPVGALLVEQAPLGVAVARNHGLAEVRSTWVTFLDQDDLWHPSRLERLTGWLARHPEERIAATTEVAFSTVEEADRLAAADPLVGSWASQLVPEATAYHDLCDQVDTRGSGGCEHFDHRAMLSGPVTVTTSFIAEAQLLRLAGGFAPHAFAMDDYWLLVNAARLHPIAKVDQPTVFYRVHVGATSRSTRLALPFLSSAVALRLGGGLVPAQEGLARAPAGPLHEHLFDELLRSDEYRSDARVRAAARHLAALLWPGGRVGARVRATVKARAPWVGTFARPFRRPFLREG